MPELTKAARRLEAALAGLMPPQDEAVTEEALREFTTAALVLAGEVCARLPAGVSLRTLLADLLEGCPWSVPYRAEQASLARKLRSRSRGDSPALLDQTPQALREYLQEAMEQASSTGSEKMPDFLARAYVALRARQQYRLVETLYGQGPVPEQKVIRALWKHEVDPPVLRSGRARPTPLPTLRNRLHQLQRKTNDALKEYDLSAGVAGLPPLGRRVTRPEPRVLLLDVPGA